MRDFSPKKRRIAITLGEPAGIGFELMASLMKDCAPKLLSNNIELVALGDPSFLNHTLKKRGVQSAKILNPNQPLKEQDLSEKMLHLYPIEVQETIEAGILNPKNRDYVLKQLHTVLAWGQSKEIFGVCTLPIQKSVLNTEKNPFLGHTEFFSKGGYFDVVMSFDTPEYRIALATTHLPLREVPNAITKESLIKIGLILQKNEPQRKLLFLGLNPHAGEQGALGKEEETILIPAIKKLQEMGVDVFDSPAPADSFFLQVPPKSKVWIVAMYHDQILPWMKSHYFDSAVNLTLGLPFFRTSPDHGTALSLAKSLFERKEEPEKLKTKSSERALFLLSELK